jgi:hypothetical protein
MLHPAVSRSMPDIISLRFRAFRVLGFGTLNPETLKPKTLKP